MACRVGLFAKVDQRRAIREYLHGLLVPRERNKTLTGLAGTEPVVGAQAAVSATSLICGEISLVCGGTATLLYLTELTSRQPQGVGTIGGRPSIAA